MKNSKMNGHAFHDGKYGIQIEFHPASGVKYDSPHWNQYLELYYFIKGDATLECPRGVVEAKAENCVVINAREVHHMVRISRNASFYRIRIDLDALMGKNLDPCQIQYLEPLAHNLLYFHNLVEGDQELNTCLNNLIEEYENHNRACELYIKSSLFRLLGILVRHHLQTTFTSKETDSLGKRLDRFTTVLIYMEENYNEDITLDTLAAMLDVTPSHFCRIFKKTFGKSAIDYVNGVRMNKAKELLQITEDSVTEIAGQCGYDDMNYFSRVFKKFNGISPSEFRKKIGGADE